MATQEREIVDLFWDGGQDASALGKLKDMLQVKAAAAVDASKLDIANKMFPHVPDDGATGLPPEGEASPEETAEVLNRNDDTEKENNDETDN